MQIRLRAKVTMKPFYQLFHCAGKLSHLQLQRGFQFRFEWKYYKIGARDNSRSFDPHTNVQTLNSCQQQELQPVETVDI